MSSIDEILAKNLESSITDLKRCQVTSSEKFQSQLKAVRENKEQLLAYRNGEAKTIYFCYGGCYPEPHICSYEEAKNHSVPEFEPLPLNPGEVMVVIKQNLNQDERIRVYDAVFLPKNELTAGTEKVFPCKEDALAAIKGNEQFVRMHSYDDVYKRLIKNK